MMVNFREILQGAACGGYAVGAFNGYNYETFKGIVEAGAESEMPVILAFGAKYLKNMPLGAAYSIAAALAEEKQRPVCLHLDHCSDMQIVFQAIKAGFGSVMYDGSALSFAENVVNTKKICEVAHACNVSVEAELGCLAAGEFSHEGSADDRQVYTDPQMAANFVAQTQVDALAVSIGTVHGMYKGRPDLRLDILEQVHRFTQAPLVLHGGSGLTKQEIAAAIARGIVKINVNTEISLHVVEQTAKRLAEQKLHLSEVSLEQTAAVKDVVKKYISFFRQPVQS